MSVDQNLNDIGGPDTPEPDIVLAVETRDLEGLKDLLRQRGVDVDAKGIYGRTALMAAVTSRQPEMVRLLLANGADITLKNYFGHTAMGYASGEVKEMLEKASVAASLAERERNEREAHIASLHAATARTQARLCALAPPVAVKYRRREGP